MSAFALSKMFMKTNELYAAFQDVDENKARYSLADNMSLHLCNVRRGVCPPLILNQNSNFSTHKTLGQRRVYLAKWRRPDGVGTDSAASIVC
jgi:hypothetical protein